MGSGRPPRMVSSGGSGRSIPATRFKISSLACASVFMFKHGFYSFLFLTPECLDLLIHHLKHILAI